MPDDGVSSGAALPQEWDDVGMGSALRHNRKMMQRQRVGGIDPCSYRETHAGVPLPVRDRRVGDQEELPSLLELCQDWIHGGTVRAGYDRFNGWRENLAGA